MKLRAIRITIGRTYNLGNYENIRVEIAHEADVELGDAADAVRAALISECREGIKQTRATYANKTEPQSGQESGS